MLPSASDVSFVIHPHGDDLTFPVRVYPAGICNLGALLDPDLLKALQPGMWGTDKDVLETRFKRLVCDSPSRRAEKAIATNWVAAYKKYVNREGCPPLEHEQ